MYFVFCGAGGLVLIFAFGLLNSVVFAFLCDLYIVAWDFFYFLLILVWLFDTVCLTCGLWWLCLLLWQWFS